MQHGYAPMNESTPDHTYDKEGFLILRKFIPHFFADYLKIYFDTLKTNDKLQKGDAQVGNSLCTYGDPAFDTFMLMSAPLISGAVGKQLFPTYTYARIYYKGSELLPHIDRDECEHSVSVFLGGEYDTLWPIWMLNKEVHKQPQMCALYSGDAVVYQGNKVHHWRDGFEGTSHYQLFMHFVEADGKHKDKIYDTRPFIGLPSDTKTDYGLSSDQRPSEEPV